MKKRKIGDSELEVTVMGFGGWGIGGPPFWQNAGDAESVRAVQTAFDLGINFFDTAPVYGFGRSERLIAKALRGKRDRVILATKAGLRWDREALSAIRKDASAASIRFEIGESLRRLETDYIDLYQVHWPDTQTPFQETMETLMQLKGEGKIRYIGLSNFSTDQMEECRKHGEVVSLQSKYNLLEREMEAREIPFCLKNKIGVIPYSPLASGLLTGKYGKDSRFKDWRGKGLLGHFSGEIYERHIDLVEEVRKIASRSGKKAHHAAINWLLGRKGVCTAIIGVKKAAQVRENVRALEWTMPREVREEIEKAITV